MPHEMRTDKLLVSTILPLKSGHGPMTASATEGGAVCLSTNVLVDPPVVYVVVMPPVTAVEASPLTEKTFVVPPITVFRTVPPEMTYLVIKGAVVNGPDVTGVAISELVRDSR
jgi:hypothetical protein